MKPGIPTLRDLGIDMSVNIFETMRSEITDEFDERNIAVDALDETLDNFSVPGQDRSKVGDLLIKVSIYVNQFPNVLITAEDGCPVDQSWLKMYRYYCEALGRRMGDDQEIS